jgi:prepilin-type N-terminal cleavage/methylation domain-containing protein
MKKAFTIIELLMAVSVIAVLMGIVGIAYNGAIKNGRAKKAQSMMVALQSAIDAYKLRYGVWPPKSLHQKLSDPSLTPNVPNTESEDGIDHNLYELSASEVASVIREIVKVSSGK